MLIAGYRCVKDQMAEEHPHLKKALTELLQDHTARGDRLVLLTQQVGDLLKLTADQQATILGYMVRGSDESKRLSRPPWFNIDSAPSLDNVLVFDHERWGRVVAYKAMNGQWFTVPGQFKIKPFLWRRLPEE